jgi:hypothetical protein
MHARGATAQAGRQNLRNLCHHAAAGIRPGKGGALAAAAARHEIDLKGLQRQLNKGGMKADAAALLTNGFIRARNFLQPGRAQLVGAADRHAAAIQAWLDTFAQGKMPTEAAAFLYLALATEEIRGHG